MAMKPISPSLREKKRYLKFRISENIPAKEVKKAVLSSVRRFMGIEGSSRMGVIFIDFKDRCGIVRVNRDYVDHLRMALMLIKNINNRKVFFRTLAVSGILDRVKR
ncbi:MAG: Rpp14/Pop5 family protein [Nanobdellota archaeon]